MFLVQEGARLGGSATGVVAKDADDGSGDLCRERSVGPGCVVARHSSLLFSLPPEGSDGGRKSGKVPATVTASHSLLASEPLDRHPPTMADLRSSQSGRPRFPSSECGRAGLERPHRQTAWSLEQRAIAVPGTSESSKASRSGSGRSRSKKPQAGRALERDREGATRVRQVEATASAACIGLCRRRENGAKLRT